MKGQRLSLAVTDEASRWLTTYHCGSDIPHEQHVDWNDGLWCAGSYNFRDHPEAIESFLAEQ